MPKLKSGGVSIEVSNYDGNFSVTSGNDYAIGEEDALVQDLVKFAKAEKIKINAFVPSSKGRSFSAAQVSKFAETLDPVLMFKWMKSKKTGRGFPSIYLAFFEPQGNTVRPTATAKTSKYARK
tara:strand:+ start:82 stop:450 length:369 start_codon:yes stop_codon:yes gene_type:complete